ncbi:GNAT family N-acetyltransferase [Senegalia massiliensis]|uniref:N-acetyltransferase n=1 Tax=Senegalia massiliensis TaxID=1720316 RepID=A0A845QS01_9CLOT|nr:GNAT family protein [Senegalia massiliensis]NBI05577.1 N-acetyltransferase [Senegalia massiliensis]
MYLKNENLVIRQADENDAKILCKWWNDGKIMAHAGFPKGLNIDIDELIDSLSNETNNTRRLIIEIDNKEIGEMSYKIVNKIAEIGIKICDFTYQEKGYGTKAIKLLIKYLFEDMKVNKIILDTNLNNTRAQHVYEKIGFKKKGIRIDSWKDQLGVLQSTVDYELNREYEK